MAAAPGFAFDGAPVKPADATLPMGSQPAAAQAVTAQALKKVPPAAPTATRRQLRLQCLP